MRGTFNTRMGSKNNYQLRSVNESHEKITAMAVSVTPIVLSSVQGNMSSHSQCEIRRDQRITLSPHNDEMVTDESHPVAFQRVLDESKAVDPPDDVVLMEDDNFGENKDVVCIDCNVPEEEKMVEDNPLQLV